MDVILDEISLVPCNDWSPASRIQTLALTLQALDRLGCARVLRSVRAAADQDIGHGRGLRGWCFASGTNRDAGRLIAQRLGKQPFIDGLDGLFAQVEGQRAIQGYARGKAVIGLALAALTGSAAVALGSEALPTCRDVKVDLTTLDDIDGEFQEIFQICCVVTEEDVRQQSSVIAAGVERTVFNGAHLMNRVGELFPRLRFGPIAMQQIAALNGNEPVFHQLFRHLRALDQGAASWRPGTEYAPSGAITWSPESNATLNHRVYGPQRDFAMPEGFESLRWTNHTKMSGGAGARLYFHPRRTGETAVVLIGYFGGHLPTVRHDG